MLASGIGARGFAAGPPMQGALGGGLAVCFGMLASIYVSGAHLNPVVSFTAFCTGRMPPIEMAVYIGAQYLGGFCAAVWLWITYYQLFRGDIGVLGVWNTPGFNSAVAAIFITQPSSPAVETWQTFWDQLMGGGILLFYLFLINGDPQVVRVGKEFQCLFSGLFVTLLGLTMGYNVGGAANPARDFGPRIFAAMVAGGDNAFNQHNYGFWFVNILGMHVGGLFFAVLLEVFVLNAMRDSGDGDNRNTSASNEKKTTQESGQRSSGGTGGSSA